MTITDRVLSWATPQGLSSVEDKRRARMLTAFVLALFLLSVPALTVYYLQQGQVTTSVVAACIGPAILLLASPLLRRIGSVKIAGNLVLFCILTGLIVATTLTGGLQSEILLWMLVLPLLAHVLINPAAGGMWTLVTITVIVVYYYLYQSGLTLRDPMPIETIRWWRAVHLSSATFFIGFLGWFYERERIRLTHASKADKARLAAVVADAPVALFCFDNEGIIWLSEGQGQEALTSTSRSWIGQSVFEVLATTKETEEKVRHALRGERVNFVVTIGGATFQVQCTPQLADGEVTGVIGVSHDTTDLARMERQLAISDRMASLGALAAGIGHEINNPLTYVLGSVEFAQSALEEQDNPDADVQEALVEALDGATRVKDIVADLRMFSPRKTNEHVPVKLEGTIGSAVNLTRSALLRSDVSVEIPPDMPQALGDASRLGQVLVNLLVNASHALPDGRSNKIRIVCFAEGDDDIVIEVHDTGKGIQATNLDKIFDPFFTTKATGTGLGLAICHEIISSMNGSLSVSSEVGKGSCFRIRLPRAP